MLESPGTCYHYYYWWTVAAYNLPYKNGFSKIFTVLKIAKLAKYHDDVIKWKKISALLAICAIPGEFPAPRPVTRSFDVFF